MSERDNTPETGVAGPVVPILTPDEKKVFGQLYAAADSENMGVVTGELAVKFFEKSGLNPRILGEIWGIADVENRGLLDKVGFSVALRLIGRAQNGEHPRKEMAQHPGPLPRFEGVSVVYPQTSGTSSPGAIQGQTTGPAGVIRVPPLTPPDVEKFTSLFEKSGAVDGILPGEVAKGIFLRSKLPTETLTQIWRLADRQGRGVLGAAEFVVAMHLITSCKNGTLPALPQILPPGLYEVAAGRPPTRNGPDRRPAGRGGPMMPPIPPIPKQFSGPHPRAQSPLSRQFTPPGPPPHVGVQRSLTGDWAISPADKQKFDQVFLTVDKQNRNFITGEEAVPFFSTSNLPEEILAQIWDLADINKAGRLSRDEFAIAMYLIRQQRTSPGASLPEVLPPNLIPPSMRQPRQMTGQPSGASAVSPTNAFDVPPPVPPPKSAAEDLFGLDSFTSAAQAPPAAAPASLGPFGGTDVFGTSKPASPAATGGPNSPMQPQGNMFGQPQSQMFNPASGFRQPGISPAGTGGSFGPASVFQPQQPKSNDMDDLLGDADPEVSKKLTNETAELANLSNQIGSLTTQTQELKAKRASTEQDLTSLTSQKQHIEVQLSQLRSAYEREAETVRQVEIQLANSRTETTKLRNDYNIAEAEYHQLQAKKQEVAAGLESDRSENESLRERMNAITAENRNLRQELERLQLQARQQKGLVTISKKQVSTSEAEREKIKADIDEAKSVASPAPASPTLSQGSTSTNPFYRNKSPPAVAENAFSPGTFSPGGPAAQSHLDDVFGPAISSQPSQPPPPASFFTQRQHPERAGTDVSVLSARSLTSASEAGGHGDLSTPPTSAPESSYHGSPHPSEAPPPSQGSQITSAFLPLPISRADSVTSSVQVNPSASVSASRPETPTNWQGSAQAVDSPARERELFPKPEDRRSSFSVKSDAGTEASGREVFPSLERDRSPFAPAPLEKNATGTTSGGDENRSLKEKRDSFSGFGSGPASGMPGGFPMAGTPNPIKQTPTGESNMSNRSRTSNMSRPAFGDQTRSDPFSLAKDESRGPASSKQDFEEAFKGLGFTAAKTDHTGGSGSVATSRFDTEFPPIEEIHHDDSDSESEAGAGGFSGGFEDNFTSSSPVQKHAQLASAPGQQSQGDTSQSSGAPPPVSAQQSPPAYGTANPQDNSGFPPEFGKLLPSRSDPMDHKAPTPGGSTNDVFFPPPPSNKPFGAPKDDFDDEFGDLAEAKEADDKADENDFSTSSGFDDFNPVFDNQPSLGKPQNAGGAAGNDDFANFSFNIDQPGQPLPPQARGESPVLQQQAKSTPEDWDAIFAGLDSKAQPASELNGPGAGAGAPADANGEHNNGMDPNEGSGVLLNTTTSAGADAGASSANNSSAAAVTAATKDNTANMEDGDKVSNLVGMGFDREKSVKALEKNGWNIDRAANSLLSDA